MKKEIWLMTQKSNVDGEIMFNVIPCATKEAAKAEMEKEIRTLITESYHYVGFSDKLDSILEKTKNSFYIEDTFIDKTENSFYIEDTCDDYYEDIRIDKREIVTI